MDNKPQAIQKKNLFEKLFSLSEFKIFGLTIALFVFLGLDIVSFLKSGDISNNLLMANAYIIGGISGISLVGMAMNTFSNNNMNQYGYSQYSSYGNNQYQPYQNGFAGTNDTILNQTNPSMSDPPVGQMPIVSNQNTNTNNPV